MQHFLDVNVHLQIYFMIESTPSVASQFALLELYPTMEYVTNVLQIVRVAHEIKIISILLNVIHVVQDLSFKMVFASSKKIIALKIVINVMKRSVLNVQFSTLCIKENV